jgi:hypothetical protein
MNTECDVMTKEGKEMMEEGKNGATVFGPTNPN